MRCLKTGCHAYSTQYGEYLYGDAFAELDDDGAVMPGSPLVIRVCQRSQTPIFNVLHFHVAAIGVWFDEDKTSGAQNSTLVASATGWNYLGYNGQPLKEGATQ